MLTGSPAVISRQRWTQFLTRVLFYLASQIFISTFSQQSGALENKPHLMPIADKKVKKLLLSFHAMAKFKLLLIFFYVPNFVYTGSIFTNLLLLISFALLSLFLVLSCSISFCLSFSLRTYVDLTHAVSSICFLSHSFSRPNCLLFVPLPTLFYLFSSNIVVCFLSQSLPLSHFYPFSHSQSLSLSIAHFRFHLVCLLFQIFPFTNELVGYFYHQNLHCTQWSRFCGAVKKFPSCTFGLSLLNKMWPRIFFRKHQALEL